MKCLVIQIIPHRDKRYSLDDFLVFTRSMGRYPEVDLGENEGHISLNYFTEDMQLLWQELQQKLFTDSTYGDWLKNVAIVGCEGEKGWDDARLLFHYDSNEQCDQL